MDKYLNQYEILFRKAKADFSAAQILNSRFCAGQTDLDLEVIYFHLQQCAEKLIKAVLSKKLINYPKTHDLEALLNLARVNNIDLRPDRDLLIELNDYAVEGRYGIVHDDIENLQKYFNHLHDLLIVVGENLRE